MPYDFTIEEKDRLLIFRCSEAFLPEEIADFVRRALLAVADEKLSCGYGTLIIVNSKDLVPEGDISKITQLISILESHLQGAIAIVASSIGCASLSRLIAFRLFRQGCEAHAFSDESEARTWLSVKRRGFRRLHL
jgi:hypothetical protein